MIPPFVCCIAPSETRYTGYAVVSDYLGRGLLNKPRVDAVELQPLPAPRAPASVPAPNTGLGAESRHRLAEGRARDLYISETSRVSRETGVVAVAEGRMRVLEAGAGTTAGQVLGVGSADRSLASVHAQMPSKRPAFTKPSSLPTNSTASPRPTAAVPKNPFEEDEYSYDDSKNPFADNELDKNNPFADEPDKEPKNPFNEYDNNLNPFS